MRPSLVLLVIGALALGSGCQSVRAGKPVEVMKDGVYYGAFAGGAPAFVAGLPITVWPALAEMEGVDPGLLEPVCGPGPGVYIMFIPAIPTGIVGAGVGAVLALPFAGAAAIVRAAEHSCPGEERRANEPPPEVKEVSAQWRRE